jgi:hypothetical protein
MALLLFAGGVALLVAPEAGCGGAKHAKVVGPPPEYEPPEPVDAALPSTVESRPDGSAR